MNINCHEDTGVPSDLDVTVFEVTVEELSLKLNRLDVLFFMWEIFECFLLLNPET